MAIYILLHFQERFVSRHQPQALLQKDTTIVNLAEGGREALGSRLSLGGMVLFVEGYDTAMDNYKQIGQGRGDVAIRRTRRAN